jgi:hypothetical protein
MVAINGALFGTRMKNRIIRFIIVIIIIILFYAAAPQWTKASSFNGFLDLTKRQITVGRTPLDELSARRRDLSTCQHAHKRETSMPSVRFEPTISAGERPHTYALDRAVTGIG